MKPDRLRKKHSPPPPEPTGKLQRLSRIRTDGRLELLQGMEDDFKKRLGGDASPLPEHKDAPELDPEDLVPVPIHPLHKGHQTSAPGAHPAQGRVNNWGPWNAAHRKH